ncbi:MAG: hypothetical protein JXA10_13305 [Anaerolineae bacterium]|nr:hypothetical protein [Anaerolineae bacterium]
MVKRKWCKLIVSALVVALLVPLIPTTTVLAQNKLVEVYLWAGEGPAWEYYTVDSATNLGLYYYWFAKTEEQIQDFLDNVTVAVSLNGTPLFETRESAHIFWAPVEAFVQQGQPLYRAEWSAMLVPLDPGEYTISFKLSLASVVEDGVASSPFGPGVIASTTNIVTVVEEGAINIPAEPTTDDDADTDDTAGDANDTTDDAIKDTNVPTPDPDVVYDEPVVGTFVSEAWALWEPKAGSLVSPNVIFQPGTALWVFGMDETRQYYKVLIDIVYLWVPVNTIGPTYDATWGGRPLPNVIVK